MQLLEQGCAATIRHGCIELANMMEQSIKEANQVELWDDHKWLLSPASRTGAVSPFLEQSIPIAVSERGRAQVPDRGLLHVARVTLSHAESEVHVAIGLFGAISTWRLWECKVADLKLLLVTKTVNRIAAINNCSDLQIEFEMECTLEPGVAREVLKTWLWLRLSLR